MMALIYYTVFFAGAALTAAFVGERRYGLAVFTGFLTIYGLAGSVVTLIIP